MLGQCREPCDEHPWAWREQPAEVARQRIEFTDEGPLLELWTAWEVGEQEDRRERSAPRGQDPDEQEFVAAAVHQSERDREACEHYSDESREREQSDREDEPRGGSDRHSDARQLHAAED